MAVDGAYAGHIVISDELKPDAKAAIAALKAQGVRKTVMLTGDAKAVGESVAKELGLDEVHAQLLPADKVGRVEALLCEKSPKGKLAFVGDGINDAPVLSRADIGIAMGALGSVQAFLKNLWEIWRRIPTPSPVLPSASLPARCSRCSTIFNACLLYTSRCV